MRMMTFSSQTLGNTMQWLVQCSAPGSGQIVVVIPVLIMFQSVAVNACVTCEILFNHLILLMIYLIIKNKASLL